MADHPFPPGTRVGRTDDESSDDAAAGLFSTPAAIAGGSQLLIDLLDELDGQRGRLRGEGTPDV